MNTSKTLHLSVELLTSPYGTPIPTLRARGDASVHYREFSATLHELAAKAERATPRIESWCVTRDRDGDTVGRISIDVARGDAREVEAAMAMLNALAK